MPLLDHHWLDSNLDQTSQDGLHQSGSSHTHQPYCSAWIQNHHPKVEMVKHVKENLHIIIIIIDLKAEARMLFFSTIHSNLTGWKKRVQYKRAKLCNNNSTHMWIIKSVYNLLALFDRHGSIQSHILVPGNNDFALSLKRSIVTSTDSLKTHWFHNLLSQSTQFFKQVESLGVVWHQNNL